MKALTQYIVVGTLALLAAVTVMQGVPASASLGWAQAAAEAALPAAQMTQTAGHAVQATAR
ncbi:MAG: hypothetical protein EOO29_34835 [Comamonadaceae bacterium]|nr:MAG: hypothetical protein EOO29_34835 [Comamonadaceae bacterium]